MQAIKCVVVGDGAVGKFCLRVIVNAALGWRSPSVFLNSTYNLIIVFRKDMSVDQLYNKCLPR